MRFKLSILIGLFLAASAGAQAQNLVTNPGFETGDFTGWTLTGDNASVDSGVGHTGKFAAAFGSLSPDVDVLSQTLLTQVGQQYTISFFAQTPQFGIPPGTPNSLSVSFGGNLVDGPFTVPDSAGYFEFTYTVTATSTASELHFEVSNDPDFTQLDDISVTLKGNQPGGTSAPEPGALSLLVIGLGGITLARLSQRKAAS